MVAGTGVDQGRSTEEDGLGNSGPRTGLQGEEGFHGGVVAGGGDLAHRAGQVVTPQGGQVLPGPELTAPIAVHDAAGHFAAAGHRQAWRDRIAVVASDPSAAFKKAITTSLPHAQIPFDPFLLAQLANLCLTRVRQRLVQEHHQRRGPKTDPAWAHHTLLLRDYDTLSPRAQ